ncbi:MULTISPECIES: SpoIIE family protein phosphatase [Caproicibacterium]|uniref:SpoIIE family protein phosphatase n=1 Tax=Caproicibacterium argilliputei TaxID=3030016 RepID=A0AA97DA12_9FIRM|nr:SpoIIE family protein phosphatase [Caproicibacterium argilliputei]WOC31778.1 SpoIIE family protein phosphatase [Caproicibacterium argilliputei]
MTKEQLLTWEKPRAVMRNIAQQAIFFALGLLSARAVVFDRCAPFGIAMAAACPWKCAPAAVLGAALGYILPGTVTVPMHCLMALLACFGIRWVLQNAAGRFLRAKAGFAAGAAGVPLLCTGMIVYFVNGYSGTAAAYAVAEALLAGAWAYFFSRTVDLFAEQQPLGDYLPQEMTCAAFSAGVFLLALAALRVGPVTAGGILAVLIILYASEYGGVAGGSVAGVAAGTCFAFTGDGLSGLAGAYGVGGLMAGLFAPMGRLPAACAFILSSAVASLPAAVTSQRMDTLWEVAVASVVYILMPERLTANLFRRVAARPGVRETPRAQDLRRTVVTRLDHAACALGEVASTVEQVGEKLDKSQQSRPQSALQELHRTQTAQNRRCMVRQFSAVSTVLEEMASEFELFEHSDETSAELVSEVLYEFALQPLDVSCRVDRFERMTIEILAMRGEDVRVNKAELTREISKVCGRTFSQPSISRTQTSWRLVFCERPLYRVVMGSARHNCCNNTLCGDSTRCFEDGTGRFLAILSDGMGSGGRAAVDGVMVSDLLAQLIQAGVGFDSALQIVNTAMGVKSGDESSATVDLVSIDLYTGFTEFRKAGAAMSFVRTQGQVHPVDAPGVPVGILEQVTFHCLQEELAADDLVVLVSDGALCEGTAWMTALLEGSCEAKTPQELAEAIVAGAVARRSDGHDDDVTAIVLKLHAYRQQAE